MREVGVRGRRGSRVRRVAAWIFAVAVVAAGLWRAEDAGWFDARAVAVSDETARAMLADVAKWDAATSGERRGIAERVAAKLEGFTLLRVRSFGFDGHRHEIAVFLHAATGLEFSLIPGGTFRMGSPESEAERESDETQHEVTLTHAFLLARTECTQAAYERVMGTNPSTGTVAADHPVETVSWDDVYAFDAKSGLRLPTEAEWEFACRAGTTTRFWSGDTDDDLSRVAWVATSDSRWDDLANSVRGWVGMKPSPPSHHATASRPSNPFGLYDMHGNVWERCEGGHEASASDPVTDTADAGVGSVRVFRGESRWYPATDISARVFRGGAWSDPATFARSAFRNGRYPVGSSDSAGFRPARSVPSE